MDLCEACGQPVGEGGYRDTENGIALCAACDELGQEEARRVWEEAVHAATRQRVSDRPAVALVA